MSHSSSTSLSSSTSTNCSVKSSNLLSTSECNDCNQNPTSQQSNNASNKIINNLTDDEDNNLTGSEGEDHKQYQAACVIQKYYRRYKQVNLNFKIYVKLFINFIQKPNIKYENLHKYTEAAVKIQTRYRIYKSSLMPSSPFIKYNENKQINYKHSNSIDETKLSHNHQPLVNQKQVARKLVNIRQSARFSPSSPLPNSISNSTSNIQTSISPVIVSPMYNINNSVEPSIDMNANNSQLHHYYHHHHHFHHHFHKGNQNESIQLNESSKETIQQPIFNKLEKKHNCFFFIN